MSTEHYEPRRSYYSADDYENRGAPEGEPDDMSPSVRALLDGAAAAQCRTAADRARDFAAFFDDEAGLALAERVLAAQRAPVVAFSGITLTNALDALAAHELAAVVATGLHGPERLPIVAGASVRIRLEYTERAAWDRARPTEAYPRRWPSRALERQTRGAVARALRAMAAAARPQAGAA